jgi:hypothetical protein
MKLAFAAACLAASLSLASQALADGRTTVTLETPVAKPIQFVADTGVWDCSGATCVASYTSDGTFGYTQCHAVAKEAGSRIVDFKDESHTLKADALDKCNAHLPGAATQTASTASPSQTATR